MSSAPDSRLSPSAFSFQLSAFHSACPSALGALLRKYFASGWAFLIPYLAAYLLYYWFKWPVNPGARSQEAGASSQHGLIPCLLHVYWTLHAINLTLGAIALCAWWRKSAEDKGDRRQESGESGQPASSILDSGSSILAPNGLTRRREGAKDLLATKNAENTGETSGVPDSLLAAATPTAQQEQAVPEFTTKDTEVTKPKALPSFGLSAFFAWFSGLRLSGIRFPLSGISWLLLALLFYIPGVYLEFPADPWQHYGRINEWSWLHTVGEHSAWTKSSYFLAYSLVGRIAPPTRQLFWLDFYHTGVCLLLCWQYYRLARAIGLGERASMFFVILQTVLFGNNIFGFYRYYGISSSIFAQLGAVALVRIAIEYAKGMGCKDTGVRNQESGVGREAQEPSALGTLQPGIPMAHEGGVEQGRSPFRFPVSGSRNWLSAVRYPLSTFRLASCLLSPVSCLLRFAASCALLLALCGFSHPQGLGIAGLGLAAVAVWRLIEWRRSMIWWLATAALVLSIIAVLFFSRDPALTAYVRDGWLTSWYGLNVFAFSLPVGDRTLQIIGIIGLVNLAAGLFLLRRNHLVGWLTITPVFALCLPFVAIPLADALAQHGDPINIVTFQRMLFAIPPGLALVALGEQIMHRVRSQELRARSLVGFSISRFFSFSVLLLSLSALLLVPANGPTYNRFWQALMVPPEDLQMEAIIAAIPRFPIGNGKGQPEILTGAPGAGFVISATGIKGVADTNRYTSGSPTIDINYLHALIQTAGENPGGSIVLLPHPSALYSLNSISGSLSGHWLPVEVQLEYAGEAESEAAARRAGGRPLYEDAGMLFLFGDWPAGNDKGGHRKVIH